MATTIQTLFNQANSAITGIDASLITLQEQSDEFNVVTAVANTTIPTANGNVSSTSSTAAYYNKAESDTLYLSTSGGTVTGNITVNNVYASGYYFANGTPFVSGGGGISAVAGVVDLSTTAYAALVLPTGTYAQRPTSAANGSIRWNTSNTVAEIYVGGSTGWQTIASTTYSINYLVVAGGGGGGCQVGGGGGAGGLITGTSISVNPGTSYALIVGAGAPGSTTSVSPGATGTNSTGFGITSLGGGGGGSHQNNGLGTSGGSGGGGGGGVSGGVSPGGGTSGQGYPGGFGVVSNWSGGGGGGSGGNGANGGADVGGNGGPGTLWNSNYYSGGGGGCSSASTLSSGGSGVGGGGWSTGNTGNTLNGAANRGGGGGGIRDTYNAGYAGFGGSGVVIVSYVGTPRASGGTVSQTGGYTYHTFTSSGTFVA
jgi:hypothetical protein